MFNSNYRIHSNKTNRKVQKLQNILNCPSSRLWYMKAVWQHSATDCCEMKRNSFTTHLCSPTFKTRLEKVLLEAIQNVLTRSCWKICYKLLHIWDIFSQIQKNALNHTLQTQVCSRATFFIPCPLLPLIKCVTFIVFGTMERKWLHHPFCPLFTRSPLGQC